MMAIFERSANMKPSVARGQVNAAIAKGIIKPNKECAICGANPGGKYSRAQFVQHHGNYNKPLETITLCCSCHRKLHLGKITLTHQSAGGEHGQHIIKKQKEVKTNG